jgi:hypothetical protein
MKYRERSTNLSLENLIPSLEINYQSLKTLLSEGFVTSMNSNPAGTRKASDLCR